MDASKAGLQSSWRSWLLLGAAAVAMIAGVAGIIASLRALEKDRVREYEALADKVSQSAMTMLINENYSNLQDLVDLLAGMSSVRYIANYVGEEIGIWGGDNNGLEKILLEAKSTPGAQVLSTVSGRFLVVTHHLPFNPDLFSAPSSVQMVFRLEPFFALRNNVLIAVGLILLLVVLLGVATWMLQRTQRRLEGAEATKSQMISGLTHHAIKFLTVIQGQITKNEMRLKAGKTPETGELKKDFRLAAQNIEALNRLIENLNDHERLKKGGVKILVERVGLEQRIAEAAASLEEMARRRDIRIEIAGLTGDLTIESDAHVVQQALINVLENAVLYTRAQTAVRIRAEASKEAVTVLVDDQGPGIAPEDQNRIFQPFVRLQPEIKGTGIGLSNARQLVRLTGGDLGIRESRPGQGTTFYLRFPRAVARKEK